MRKTLIVLVIFALIATYSFAGTATASFDEMKALEGKWIGKNSKGEPVSVSYELVANGTALVETLHGMNEIMTTVYHTDGSNLMMTHYCGAGNQPRMRADLSGGNAKVIPFAFFDGTNIPSQDTPHMHKLQVTFIDQNHFSQQWTFMDHGKEMSDLFTFERAKN